jgi:hypothetical protein
MTAGTGLESLWDEKRRSYNNGYEAGLEVAEERYRPLIEAARAYRDADAALLRTYQSPPNRDHEVVARQHFTRSVARLHEAARTLEGHVEEGTP